jgi:hypothetical protein
MLETIDGLVLEAKWPQLQYVVKGPIQDEWRDGIPVRRAKHLILEFDRYLLIMDDLVREKEWDDEDKLYILRQLNYELGRPQFVDFWEHKMPVPNAPWPNYNDTPENQVITIAQATGLIAEALRYENAGRPGGPREKIVLKLNQLLGDAPADEFETLSEDELAAV